MGEILKHRHVSSYMLERRNIHALFHGLLIVPLSIRTTDQELALCIRVLPSRCAMLYYMIDTELFLQPHSSSHCDSVTWNAVSSASVCSSQRTQSLSACIQINETGVWLSHSLIQAYIYIHICWLNIILRCEFDSVASLYGLMAACF